MVFQKRSLSEVFDCSIGTLYKNTFKENSVRSPALFKRMIAQADYPIEYNFAP